MSNTDVSTARSNIISRYILDARQALAAGRDDLFELACANVDRLQPDNPEIANLRGIVCAHFGKLKQAREFFTLAVRGAPNQSQFHVNLARLCLGENDHDGARIHFGEALKLEPESLALQLAYSQSLMHFGNFEEAVAILEPALSSNPDHDELCINLIWAYDNLPHHFEKALQLLDQAEARNPEHPGVILMRAQLDREEGHLDAAEANLRKLLNDPARRIEALKMLCPIKRFTDPGDPDIALMNNIYSQSAPDSQQRMDMAFSLGKVQDDLKKYDQAFAYFREANDIRRKGCDYNESLALAYLEKTSRIFTPEILAQNSGISDSAPIFIVGMPRCGSTLTEQILSAHPDVLSRGECGYLEGQALEAFHSPENPITLDRMAAFTAAEWRQLGDTYLKYLKGNDHAASHITDKSLQNIWLIGAIRCALPNARIIHVQRQPLNSCLSMYKIDFRNNQLNFTYNLAELGNYYRMYQQVMQHWRQVLPEGTIYELEYEKLVTDQEGETRKLLKHCGLAWNDACLQFNTQKNKVKSSSIAQVRNPIYTDSLATWKRYEKHLQPLIQALETEPAL